MTPLSARSRSWCSCLSSILRAEGYRCRGIFWGSWVTLSSLPRFIEWSIAHVGHHPAQRALQVNVQLP